MSSQKTVIQGTPIECGEQVFHKFCLPTLKAAAPANPTHQEWAQLYGGFLMACMGAMAADFGQQGAVDIVQVFIKIFAELDLPEGRPQ